MKQIVYYITLPLAAVVAVIGVGLTFGFLANFNEYQKFKSLYNMEKGNNDGSSTYDGELPIIFDLTKPIKTTLSKYNSTSDKESYINQKLTNLFIVDQNQKITYSTLPDEITKLKRISNMENKEWELYKEQYIIADVKNKRNIFQTINYLETLSSVNIKIVADDVWFGVGLGLLIPSSIAFIGLLFFYYTNKKHGIDSDFEDEGVVFRDEKDKPKDDYFDRKNAIEQISNSSEMKNYLNSNREPGFKNPILQPKPTINTPTRPIDPSKFGNQNNSNIDQGRPKPTYLAKQQNMQTTKVDLSNLNKNPVSPTSKIDLSSFAKKPITPTTKIDLSNLDRKNVNPTSKIDLSKLNNQEIKKDEDKSVTKEIKDLK